MEDKINWWNPYGFSYEFILVLTFIIFLGAYILK
jgi:hypothetical protein